LAGTKVVKETESNRNP